MKKKVVGFEKFVIVFIEFTDEEIRDKWLETFVLKRDVYKLEGKVRINHIRPSTYAINIDRTDILEVMAAFM